MTLWIIADFQAVINNMDYEAILVHHLGGNI